MPSDRKYTYLLVLTSLICILALYLYRHRQGNTGRIDQWIINLTGALQKQFFYMGQGTKTVADHYVLLVTAQKRADSLQLEVEDLKSRLTQLQDVLIENDRLRQTLEFRAKQKKRLLSAHVVAHDASLDFVGIRIDKGRLEGVEVGMGVVSPAGVVGRVKTVADHYADVITLIDPTSNLDVIIQRSRARGILSGMSKKLVCRLKYVDRLEDVIANDTVVSTDFGDVFPGGHPVGTVQSVSPNTNGILQQVVIKPQVDVYRLEEVLVVISQPQSKTLSE